MRERADELRQLSSVEVLRVRKMGREKVFRPRISGAIASFVATISAMSATLPDTFKVSAPSNGAVAQAANF